MALATLFIFFFFLVFHQAFSRCPPSFNCGDFGPLEFPLTVPTQPGCGLFIVNCTSEFPMIQFSDNGVWYDVLEKISSNKLFVRDNDLRSHLGSRDCSSFKSLPVSPSCSLTVVSNITFFKCMNDSYNEGINEYFQGYKSVDCLSSTGFYRDDQTSLNAGGDERMFSSFCSKVELPRNTSMDSGDLFELLTAEYVVEWNVYDNCSRCYSEGGQCVTNDMDIFFCRKGTSHRTLILATVTSGGGVLLVCLSIFLILWTRKKRIKGAYLLSRNISSDPSSKSEESGSFYYGIPIFSYDELEEATNNFDPNKELGDGAFGTVYHGILKDGREVAIKRFYEHNFKRLDHFMNEIKVLTCLKHPNLVILYGCTSRISPKLLLVYEYIQNGTVADHLHGDKAKESPLSWAIRMKIAIETASALSYLHKSDIVHRDVKTNNILLDDNFCVKVADFGLSRLFPNDVTHISTAPQGTPGYVDPDYHQCYQLTDKSDVYSFGVVLIELISSLPAVDVTRRRREINLANLALDRIQKSAFDELIDSSLGYKSDTDVTRMTTSVAELAFRCLQLEKDMRPTMDEVLHFLREIQSGEDLKFGCGPSPEMDDVVLLKNKVFRSSPNSVTDAWDSGSTTRSSIV